MSAMWLSTRTGLSQQKASRWEAVSCSVRIVQQWERQRIEKLTARVLQIGSFMNYIQALVVVICRIITSPWYCLETAVSQVLSVEDDAEMVAMLDKWRENKKTEFNFTSLAVSAKGNRAPTIAVRCFWFGLILTVQKGTVVASAVTGSLQWGQLQKAHWLVPAVWYGSLILSLFCVIIALHLNIFMATCETPADSSSVFLKLLKKESSAKPRWSSLFILQAPIMTLSYSIMSYLVGLLLLVIQPLWVEDWGNDGKVRILLRS
ncbi:hypothetical protein MMC28_000192 [Mycoblastus sanguinarius]|nr:hypothetical protein [Mycoblastus sanguinarius]